MSRRFRTASIYGLGYVGLPTAAVFADAGLTVIGVDVNANAVESINRGEPHIVEANLDLLLYKVVKAGALRATTVPEKADVYIIAVPTPFKDDNKPDLAYVESATRMIAPLLEKGNLVILESTSPVGTTEAIAGWLAEDRCDLTFPGDVHVAHCPERILPGKVIYEVLHNDRIIGGMTPECSSAAVEFYKIAVKGECHVTNARTAELCKLSENAFRDVNIAFANEMSLICDRAGIDVWELIALTNKHPRVEILRPGPGVGGHCIAVDPWFIVDSFPEETRLIKTARLVNDGKPHWVVEKVREAAAGMVSPKIACFGLAYKPDVDDFRESPSVEVARILMESGAEILICEPFADELPGSLGVMSARLVDAQTAMQADILVFLTGHTEFKSLDMAVLRGKPVIDACGLFRN